jgi:SAM-dependent methyltransferase
MKMYRLKKMASFAKGKILDIGFTDQPNKYLRGEVFGLDINKPKDKPDNYKDYYVHDATRLAEIKEHYDTILAGEIIEHLDSPQDFLSGCNEILNPGGTLVISTPNPYYIPIAVLEMLMIRRFFYATDHVNLYLPRFLVRMLERFNFVNIHVYSGGIDLPVVNTNVPFPYPFCGLNIYTGQKPEK